jgi:hypothetical protein
MLRPGKSVTTRCPFVSEQRRRDILLGLATRAAALPLLEAGADESFASAGNPPAQHAKDYKDSKDQKDFKDGKDGKDAKEYKDGKDQKDFKDGKDGKDAKEYKDGKDQKDFKDGKDSFDGHSGAEGRAELEALTVAAQADPVSRATQFFEPESLNPFSSKSAVLLTRSPII